MSQKWKIAIGFNNVIPNIWHTAALCEQDLKLFKIIWLALFLMHLGLISKLALAAGFYIRIIEKNQLGWLLAKICCCKKVDESQIFWNTAPSDIS